MKFLIITDEIDDVPCLNVSYFLLTDPQGTMARFSLFGCTQNRQQWRKSDDNLFIQLTTTSIYDYSSQ